MKKCRKIFERQRINGFSFDAEILFIAKKHGLKVKEVGVSWYNDSESKVKLIKHSLIMFFDLLRIRINDLNGKYS